MPDYSAIYDLANKLVNKDTPIKDNDTDILLKEKGIRKSGSDIPISNKDAVNLIKNIPGSQRATDYQIERDKVYTPPIDIGTLSQPSMFVPSQSTTDANGTQGMSFNSQNTQTGKQAQDYKSIPLAKPEVIPFKESTGAKPMDIDTLSKLLPKTDKPGEPMNLGWLSDLLGVAEAAGKGYTDDKTPGYLAKKFEADASASQQAKQIQAADALESKRAKNRLAEIMAGIKAKSAISSEDELF